MKHSIIQANDMERLVEYETHIPIKRNQVAGTTILQTMDDSSFHCYENQELGVSCAHVFLQIRGRLERMIVRRRRHQGKITLKCITCSWMIWFSFFQLICPKTHQSRNSSSDFKFNFFFNKVNGKIRLFSINSLWKLFKTNRAKEVC